jgi:hypothetical protein
LSRICWRWTTAAELLAERTLALQAVFHKKDVYIYIIYTPNLGFEITVLGREREHGRFRGSSEGARGRSKGAPREPGGALKGAAKEQEQER